MWTISLRKDGTILAVVSYLLPKCSADFFSLSWVKSNAAQLLDLLLELVLPLSLLKVVKIKKKLSLELSEYTEKKSLHFTALKVITEFYC